MTTTPTLIPTTWTVLHEALAGRRAVRATYHHRLHQHGRPIQIFEPQLDTRQHQVLRLLGIPKTAYQHSR